jgi:amino acid transporter
VPRLACSLAAQGDAPVFLGKLHSRFKTPSIAIIVFAAFIWLLSATGAYLWIAALGSGALIIIYSGGCVAPGRHRWEWDSEPEVQLRSPAGRDQH